MLKQTMPMAMLAIGLAMTQALAQVEPQSPFAVPFKGSNPDFKPVMVKATFMGVTAERISQAMNSQLKLPEGVGLVVTHVVPDGPAAEAGLRKHDVLQNLNDQLLVNFEQFAVLIRLHKPGDTVKLAVIRGGESVSIDVTLTEREVPEHSLNRLFRGENTDVWIGSDRSGPFDLSTLPPPPGLHPDAEKLRSEILRTLPERPLVPGGGHVLYAKDRYQMRIVDDGHRITINKLGDEGALVRVEDDKGHILHDGPWEPGEKLSAALPQDVIKTVQIVLTTSGVGQPIRIKAEQIELVPAPGQPEVAE